MPANSTIIPCLRYRDAKRMIDWLCSVFGFERQLVVDDGHGSILHAQLTLGGGMVMLGSERLGADVFGQLQKTPAALGGTTQSPCVVVDDADDIYARVKAAGGRIVIEIENASYGGRGFSCLDPEGHLWNIGTYDPWKRD
jgi:uncharacterized glyoxalase superfamily protein PhnB